MVNYKLSYKDKNKYVELKWNIEDYERFNSHCLEDIDKFTLSFKTRSELNGELIRLHILLPEQANEKLSIRYDFRGSNKIIQYGIALADDKMFFDEYTIVEYLTECYSDTVLLEKLVNHYKNSHVNFFNVQEMAKIIPLAKTNSVNKFDLYDYKQAVINFVDREIYKHNSSDYSYALDSNGKRMINYRGFHDLAAFLAYDYKTRKFPFIKEQQDKKVKILKQIPGQMSLF